MNHARLTRDALADLEAIAEYIGSSDEVAATRLVEKLRDRCRSLAKMPGMGRAREDIAPGFRSSHVGPYLIFYKEEEGGIGVLRIVHGHRDLPSVFDQGDDPAPS